MEDLFDIQEDLEYLEELLEMIKIDLERKEIFQKYQGTEFESGME